jgi:hypothetical protein
MDGVKSSQMAGGRIVLIERLLKHCGRVRSFHQ